MTDSVQQALDAIATRREGGIADIGAEMRTRIAELGRITLNSQARQNAFAEFIDALTPGGFDLFLMPDSCRIDPVGNEITITGVFVDGTHRQVVGQIVRHLELDIGRATHELLKLESPYRGSGLAILLLDRSFEFYEQAGIERVAVHAALETGRWYWARLGFNFESLTEQALVAVWGTLVLDALGEPVIPIDSKARRWAQLGSGEPPRTVSLEELQSAVSGYVATRLADPQQAPIYEQVGQTLSRRLGADWVDPGRFELCAEQNALAIDEQVPLGRAIMLTGPDWHGVFELSDQAARDAFDEELNNALKKLAK